MSATNLATLLENQQDGFSLQQGFYKDPEIYKVEMERIFMKSWLYAGHVSEIPEVGDYILHDFDPESVIIIRENEETINALLNVCRHRAAPLVDDGAEDPFEGLLDRLVFLFSGHTRLKTSAHCRPSTGMGQSRCQEKLPAGMAAP